MRPAGWLCPNRFVRRACFTMVSASLLITGCIESAVEPTADPEHLGGAERTLSFDPEPHSVNVPLDVDIEVHAASDIDPDSIDDGAVRLYGPQNQVVPVSVTSFQEGLLISPEQALNPWRTYTMAVQPSLRAANGSPLVDQVTKTFFTTRKHVDDLPPAVADWEAHMVEHGERIGELLLDLSDAEVRDPSGEVRNQVYYDGARVFYQIADYLGGEQRQRWLRYARRAREIYVNGYLEPNDYNAAPWMRFSHGVYDWWQRGGGGETSRQALVKLRDNPPFSNPESGKPSWYHQRYSREIAYALESNIMAEKAGEPRLEARMENYLDMALTHIQIWTTGEYLDSDPEKRFVQAFMTGLTASALIEYLEHERQQGRSDNRIRPALETLADWLWHNMWVADADGNGNGAFLYINRSVEGVGAPNPAPDLNLLIAPLYAWLYKETRDPVYRDRADLIFSGGVAQAYLDGSGKRFNQNYRNSFGYLRWRSMGP